MKLFSVLLTCLRNCVNLNSSFVPHCVKIHWLIEFYYAGLAKTSKKNLETIRFVVIIVVIRNRCGSRALYASYEAVSAINFVKGAIFLIVIPRLDLIGVTENKIKNTNNCCS